MNYRITFILVVLFVVVGGYVFLRELQKTPESEPEPPILYQVQQNDILRISVTYLGETQAFVRREREWFFENKAGEAGDAANTMFINNLPISSPRTKRELEAQPVDPALLGLDPPVTTFVITLRGEPERHVNMLLGNKTPDGEGHYVQFQLDERPDRFFIIDYTWGDLLNGLVTDPPVLIETPVAGDTTATEA